MTYIHTLATITATRLGWEDGGMFRTEVELAYGHGHHQAFAPCLDPDDVYPVITGILAAVGVRSWEALRSRNVIAVRDAESLIVKGMLPLPTSDGDGFVLTPKGVESYTAPDVLTVSRYPLDTKIP